MLDAVYSLRLRYSVVDRIMRRYNASRRAAGADPSKDGLAELIASIGDAGGDDGFSSSIGTHNKSAPATKKVPVTLKTTTARQAAIALQECGIETAADLRAAVRDRDQSADVKRAWLSVRGLGLVSWDYLLMLVGEDGTKPDTMVCRFVGEAVGVTVGPDRARLAVQGAAAALSVEVGALDRAVWRFQSGRTPD